MVIAIQFVGKNDVTEILNNRNHQINEDDKNFKIRQFRISFDYSEIDYHAKTSRTLYNSRSYEYCYAK